MHKLEERQAQVCDFCDWIFFDEDPEPLYECPECGEMFTRSNSYTGDNHQCPYDRRFSSRVGVGCPDCNEETSEETVYYCSECDEYYREADIPEGHSGDDEE